MKFEIIDLEWEEPFEVGYDRKTDTYNLETIPSDLLAKYGLYQIYGRHPVYGQEVLLYVGETKPGKSGKRTFNERLKEHINGRFYYHTNLSISLCPLNIEPDKVVAVESILIATHKPALNRQHLDSVVSGAENILVRNWGFMRSLQNECSGDYHSW